jgi:hypothetical protein
MSALNLGQTAVFNKLCLGGTVACREDQTAYKTVTSGPPVAVYRCQGGRRGKTGPRLISKTVSPAGFRASVDEMKV